MTRMKAACYLVYALMITGGFLPVVLAQDKNRNEYPSAEEESDSKPETEEQDIKYLRLENEIVCWVNDEKISKRDIEQRMGLVFYKLAHWKDQLIASGHWKDPKYKQQFYELYFPPFQDELRKTIHEELMYQEAKKQEIEIDPIDLERRIKASIAFARQNNIYDKPGFTEFDIKNKVRKTMITEQFRQSLVSFMDLPSRRDVVKYHEENQSEYKRPPTVKLRRFKVKIYDVDLNGQKKVRKDALERAESYRNDIVAFGEDFAALAKEKSEDEPEILKAGGLMPGKYGDGYIDLKSHANLVRYAQNLELNQVSEVFKLDGESWGFVVIEDRKEQSLRPLDDDLYKEIKDKLTEELLKNAEIDWFKKTLKKSVVMDGKEKFLPEKFFFPNDPAYSK